MIKETFSDFFIALLPIKTKVRCVLNHLFSVPISLESDLCCPEAELQPSASVADGMLNTPFLAKKVFFTTDDLAQDGVL